MPCHVTEDELHFVCPCVINNDARECIYDKNRVYSDFNNLNEDNKFLSYISNFDVRILNWLGKFINHSFQIRDRKTNSLLVQYCDAPFGSIIRNPLLLLLSNLAVGRPDMGTMSLFRGSTEGNFWHQMDIVRCPHGSRTMSEPTWTNILS